jgi:CYTH domain-containing protein/CHAD domain-containing protein
MTSSGSAHGREIERKFVLEAMPAEVAGAPGTAIEQGYLAVDGDAEVRLRREGERRRLTVKRGHGESRGEIEVELASDPFDDLWPLTAGRRLRKTRHRVPLGEGLVAEVDRYEGELEGLVVAEVEFPSEEAARRFRPPPWFGREATGDPAFANQNLAHEGAPLDRAGERGETERPVASGGDKQDRDESPGGNGAAYRLEPGEPAPDGIRRIAAGRAAKARKRLGEVEGEDGAAAIHSARKDLKKLRSVLRLVREALGEKVYTEQNRRYRDAGRLLSDTRDAEVKVETLDELERRFGEEFPSAAAAPWRAELERERYAAAADAGGAVGERVERAAAEIDAGRNEIGLWELDEDSWKLVAPGALTAYGEGREALKLVRKDPSAENVHEWRKRAKDLWYQLRILRELWPPVLGEAADAAHGLADLLGNHHDLAVLGEDLEARDVLEPAAIRELIARRQRELIAGAIAIGERLYAEKPKAFGKRIGAYWAAARGQ